MAVPALGVDRKVAVIGSGAMGAGIAQVAAAAGYTVQLFDTRPQAVDKALADIGAMYLKLSAKGRMTIAEAEQAHARLQAADSLEQVAGAALVVEAIVENFELKRMLFAGLEKIVAEDCILATNTSSISITAIGATLRRPDRLVGMHFFNPVPLMALVEVISGLATDCQVAQTVFATAQAWGKRPVHARSTPGFIVNRVARPFYAEALRLLREQATDPATLDAIMREAGGFRMGPCELMDLIGHDVNLAVTESVWRAHYCDPRYAPSVLQREMVDAGHLGRKNGKGFFDYSTAMPAPSTEPACPAPPSVMLTMEADAMAPALAAITARLEQAGVTVRHGRPALDAYEAATPALHVNGAAVFLTDGRSATERARINSHPDTVLFDLALDFGTATRIALARADQCRPEAWESVAGMFGAAGFQVSRIDDAPGMVVMRTVAMLANEAADAVLHGVGDAESVDLAMQLGVNYPRGPLAWADAVGLDHIVTVLSNLGASYGEERYRVSPLLRRKLAAGRFHG
ncbi:MAG: 3-hydroxyacyl-CoA dehydrogenase [Massilia sp.]